MQEKFKQSQQVAVISKERKKKVCVVYDVERFKRKREIERDGGKYKSVCVFEKYIDRERKREREGERERESRREQISLNCFVYFRMRQY
jgi:hypothetical protein